MRAHLMLLYWKYEVAILVTAARSFSVSGSGDGERGRR